MAEGMDLASAIITLTSAAYASCQILSSTFDEIRNAPKRISALASDLEDLYLVLGTLQALVSDEDTSAGVIQPTSFTNLTKVL
jgi:ABC-type hemin transport system substrate-binding protein